MPFWIGMSMSFYKVGNYSSDLEYDLTQLPTEYISPLLTELSPLHNFTIETGIQYYAPLSIELQVTEEGSFVESDVLREFVNSAGWNVGEYLEMTGKSGKLNRI